MNKIISTFFISISMLFGCEKPYNKNVVNVHAYNALDSSGIEGVYVAVYKEPNGDLGKEKTAADGYTNSAGELTLTYKKFKLFKAFQLYDYFDNENYEKIKMYRNGVEWNGEGQTGGTKVTDFDITYAPVCTYSLRLVNLSCFNSNDSLFLYTENIIKEENNFLSEFVIGVGQMNYTAVGCFDKNFPSSGNTNAGNRRYYGYVKRDNGTTYFDTTIFVQPWQDNLIELYF